jgi:4-diphosphocytidyl-2-C-methyl-D-erythritol kinase
MVLSKNSYTRVTLALDIVRKLETGPYTGYHELGTVKHQIDLCDTVRVEEWPADVLECDDPLVPCDDRNVCLKVLRLVQQRMHVDRHVRISLDKRIPVMAGLAGGSANAAATLTLLNELWELRLSIPQCIDLGRKVGMDVPYYFYGGTAFDSEAGQRLEPVATDCSFVFVLACPDFGVSTTKAYAGIDYAVAGQNQQLTMHLRKALETGDRNKVFEFMHNDFELSVFSGFPRCSSIKKELLGAGCCTAHLTGSGSTVIGIARDLAHAEAIGRKISCKTIIAATVTCGSTA